MTDSSRWGELEVLELSLNLVPNVSGNRQAGRKWLKMATLAKLIDVEERGRGEDGRRV
jgi:hypothetical protein